MSVQKAKRITGFTLVELLVVVIILAVLASIVVPQFASSTDDAKVAALDSTLSELRNSIELYYHQHGGTYPGAKATTSGGTANIKKAFIDQLTLYTDSEGITATTKTTTFKYGPYLRKLQFPKNPIDNSDDIIIKQTGDLTAGPETSATGGWWFDTVSGKFNANISKYKDH